MLFRYESEAGPAGRPAATMPAAASKHAAGARLVMTIHPRCACSRASIEELARVMTACAGRLTATVLVVRPAGKPEGWEKTDLWTAAARIPGVTVVTDAGGVKSEMFGAETSGFTLLYDGEGKLIFSGGITESRGHAGDNDGELAIIALVCGERGAVARGGTVKTPVYGCSLFDQPAFPITQGGVP